MGLYTMRESLSECESIHKGKRVSPEMGAREHSPAIRRSRGGGQGCPCQDMAKEGSMVLPYFGKNRR